MYTRKQLFLEAGNESLFLWGARQTGKSVLLKKLFPDALWIDLLLDHEYQRFLKNPGTLHEMVLADPRITTVVIDEIQRLPALIYDVHWVITNTPVRVIMSGSSPRKILRSGANLLGGRALRYELYPLVSAEVPDLDLQRALTHGLLPRHYNSANPSRIISSYIGSYLRDEIMAEAHVRNLPAFRRFLEVAALTNGEIVNYTNIASDTGVSQTTAKEYFQILEDTLLGRYLPSFQKRPKRRVIMAPKFYLFDVGIVNSLLKRGKIEMGTELFGRAFEHFIYQEIYAHSRYSELDYTVCYWRTASQLEIDFVLGDHEVAIEIKSTVQAHERHLKGLTAFADEYTTKMNILVTNDPAPRQMGKVLVLPWRVFLQKLWAGEIMN